MDDSLIFALTMNCFSPGPSVHGAWTENCRVFVSPCFNRNELELRENHDKGWPSTKNSMNSSFPELFETSAEYSCLSHFPASCWPGERLREIPASSRTLTVTVFETDSTPFTESVMAYAPAFVLQLWGCTKE